MLTLESYIAEGIQRDREDIAAVERELQDTCATIAATFDPQKKTWPYEIRSDEVAVGATSDSTVTMMIRAIDLLLESERKGADRPAYAFKIDGQNRETLEEQRAIAYKNLATRLKQGGGKRGINASRIITKSQTYGLNDPLTLSFLTEILAIPTEGSLVTEILAVTKKRLELDPNAHFPMFFNFKEEKEPRKPVLNAFIPLLVLRAARTLNTKFRPAAAYLRYFESTLHDQLSFSNIPDSRFDPAELIFSLEGVLRLSDQTIDVRLFDRVLDVLEKAQQTSAHWRPSKPFLRTEKGLVLFPISVEAANSLLWCCESLDKDDRFHGRSERYVSLFRRFWNWLAARRVSLSYKDRSISGWHSDHIADPNSIQLWDTAQVVGFLLGYRRSLHNHIARTTLHLSRFNVRKPKRVEESWSADTREKQHARNVVNVAIKEDKASLRSKFEPVAALGKYFETYRKIEQEFLIPWLEGAPESYSMLLYGPPGTGKTTVAENIADALGFRLITITVSDFLAGGGGEVEARAKMIFDVLEAQANVVILFDEIDELVLDRSSKRHGQQDTVFRFMTPGMLTKLNNLRRAERCIFIMATNYAYRIDPAIRRTGRVDENYLLLPPDANSRKAMIKKFLGQAVTGEKIVPNHELDPKQIKNAGWRSLERNSFFLGYKDIEAAVSRVIRNTGAEGALTELNRELLNWGRTTTLHLYNNAFDETDDRDAVEKEFLPLVELARREGGALRTLPVLNNENLFKENKKTGTPTVYASAKDMGDAASKFVQKYSPDYRK